MQALTAATAAPIFTSKKIDQVTSNYEVHVEVPHVEDSFNPQGAQSLNQSLESRLTSLEDGFKKDNDAAPEAGSEKSQLSSGTKEVYHDDRVLSLETDNWTYSTGAAHGQPWVETTLYDRKEGKEVGLKDLFKPGSNYAQAISGAAIAQLEASDVSDTKWISEGAGPKDDNFQAFYPTDKGLTVLFQPYQVGPYSAGEPSATIPWSTLKPILNPNGPLTELAH